MQPYEETAIDLVRTYGGARLFRFDPLVEEWLPTSFDQLVTDTAWLATHRLTMWLIQNHDRDMRTLADTTLILARHAAHAAHAAITERV